MRLFSLAGLCAGYALAPDPEMVRVPAADCPIKDNISHNDGHKAKVGEFWIGKYPVTNAEYKRFVDDSGHRAPEHNSLNSKYQLWQGKSFPEGISRQPAVNVSWSDASAY